MNLKPPSITEPHELMKFYQYARDYYKEADLSELCDLIHKVEYLSLIYSQAHRKRVNSLLESMVKRRKFLEFIRNF